MDDKLNKLMNDAQLHVNEAEKKIVEWKIKHSERLRHLNTIEIIKGEKYTIDNKVLVDILEAVYQVDSKK